MDSRIHGIIVSMSLVPNSTSTSYRSRPPVSVNLKFLLQKKLRRALGFVKLDGYQGPYERIITGP
jgi:hypothetical protein